VAVLGLLGASLFLTALVVSGGDIKSLIG